MANKHIILKSNDATFVLTLGKVKFLMFAAEDYVR